MIYILEGLDKSGKSTFASKFKTATVLPADKYTNCRIQLQKAINLHLQGQDVILDRSFISELCYGPVYRKHCVYSNEDIHDFVTKLIPLPVIILYFDRPISRCHFDTEDEFECNARALAKVKRLYVKWMKFFARYLSVYRINYVEAYSNEEKI